MCKYICDVQNLAFQPLTIEPRKVACMPADVVKTRLQNGQHRYDGVMQCCLPAGVG
jgi:DhnA family fructose-bisphosphate aldolase class Ia